MEAPQLMHGNDWAGQDVSGWWASEKLRGWRVLWDGSKYVLRSGGILDVPKSWLDGMPKTPLDGELYAGRHPNEGRVNSAVASGRWDELSFRPFDVPGLDYSAARKVLFEGDFPPHCNPVESRIVESNEEAFQMRDTICNIGGEGIMLRKPGTEYSSARVDYVLKLKL